MWRTGTSIASATRLPSGCSRRWFILSSVLAKASYVKQTYFGYPAANIQNGGEFKGMMLEGVIVF